MKAQVPGKILMMSNAQYIGSDRVTISMVLTDILRKINMEISRVDAKLQAEFPNITTHEFRLVDTTTITCNATRFDVRITMVNTDGPRVEKVVHLSVLVDGINQPNIHIMRRVKDEYPLIFRLINANRNVEDQIPDFWLSTGVVLLNTSNISGDGVAMGFIGIDTPT